MFSVYTVCFFGHRQIDDYRTVVQRIERLINSGLFYLNLLFFVTHSVSPKKISPTGPRHIPKYGEVRGAY